MAQASGDYETNLIGCVKWFNNSLSYGFVTVLTEGVNHNTDVFVHQSNIKTKTECFRTLYAGECIQFALAKSDNEKHPFHAINVVGFNGAVLNCENPNYRQMGSNTYSHGGNGNGRGGNDGGNRGGYTGGNRGGYTGGNRGGGYTGGNRGGYASSNRGGHKNDSFSADGNNGVTNYTESSNTDDGKYRVNITKRKSTQHMQHKNNSVKTSYVNTNTTPSTTTTPSNATVIDIVE